MDVHVCKHAVCGLKSELRSTTEHSEVMIQGLKEKKKKSMLLFSLVSPPWKAPILTVRVK